jgi:hypothetical protein
MFVHCWGRIQTMKTEIENLGQAAIEAGEQEERIRQLGLSLQATTDKLREDIETSAGWARNPNLTTDELHKKFVGDGRRARDNVIEGLWTERNSLIAQLNKLIGEQKVALRELESLVDVLGKAREVELRRCYLAMVDRIKSSILIFCSDENEAKDLATAFSVCQKTHVRISAWRRGGPGAGQARALVAELMTPLPLSGLL